MERPHVRILAGRFAGHEGELVSPSGDGDDDRQGEGRGDKVVVRVELVLDRTDVELPEDVLPRLRARIAAEYRDWAEERKFAFFLDRVDAPEDDPAGEWDAYRGHAAGVEGSVRELGTAALAEFDLVFPALSAGEALARVEGEPARWTPGRRARDLASSTEADDTHGEVSEVERVSALLEGRRPSVRHDRARRRRDAARDAAEDRDYALWRATRGAPDTRSRDAASARVARERPYVEARFARDCGDRVRLPDALFRFREFWLTAGPAERDALDDMGLRPFGVMDLFPEDAADVVGEAGGTDSDTGGADASRSASGSGSGSGSGSASGSSSVANEGSSGPDARVHGRFYRDPPEFVTFLRGGADGLHFGLWFDDGVTCSGVASYYDNDGGYMGVPSGTPLTAVRARLELHWRDLTDAAWRDGDTPADADSTRRRFGLRALRELLTGFETRERPEQGWAYYKRYGPAGAPAADPRRLATLDGAGALVVGERIDGPGFGAGPHDDPDRDRDAVRARAAKARRRCAAGDAAAALVLGRDLHWASRRDPERERLARELLALAYRSLGRDGLARIVEAHHVRRGGGHVDSPKG